MPKSGAAPEKSRFDAQAKTWDEQPVRVALGRAVARAVAADVPLHPGMRALDFGCGTGLLTLPVAARVREVTAADTSEGMLAVLAEKIRALNVANVSPFVLPGSGAPPWAEAFDLIVCGMVFHHIGDEAGQLEKFFGWLRPGGWIAVADLETEDGTFHPADSAGDVKHLGFDPAGMAALAAGAGFSACRARTVHAVRRPDRPGREYPIFLLTAQKRP